jgi:hypothetical protein
MDMAYVSAMAALAGSVVGGLTSSGATWLSQLAQVRAGEMAHEMKLHEDLPGVHHRGFKGVRRCSPKQRTAYTGARVSLRHDQPDAHSVFATHHRVCGQDHADDHRHLLRAESLSQRAA